MKGLDTAVLVGISALEHHNMNLTKCAGPVFCGPGNCTSTCNRKSECDPGWGSQWSNASTCPLKVCCSQYGFCGEQHHGTRCNCLV